MDPTPVSPEKLAERNGGFNKRWPALPWALWHRTGEVRMSIVGNGRRGRGRLLSGTLATVVALLVFSGCAAAQNAVSPAPTLGEGSGALIAALTPESTNTHGSGTARLQLNPEQQTICSVIHVAGIELPATAAHIHKGAAGVIGPILVHLPAPNGKGLATGCTHTPRALIEAIMRHPAGYYVNVHNMPYPEGAVRGQLSACTSGTSC